MGGIQISPRHTWYDKDIITEDNNNTPHPTVRNDNGRFRQMVLARSVREYGRMNGTKPKRKTYLEMSKADKVVASRKKISNSSFLSARRKKMSKEPTKTAKLATAYLEGQRRNKGRRNLASNCI